MPSRAPRKTKKQKEEALQRAKIRAAHGSYESKIELKIAPSAALMYLRREWGFQKTQAIEVALLYLAKQTKAGLMKIDLDGNFLLDVLGPDSPPLDEDSPLV